MSEAESNISEPKISIISKDTDGTTTSTNVGAPKRSKKRKNRWGVKPSEALDSTDTVLADALNVNDANQQKSENIKQDSISYQGVASGFIGFVPEQHKGETKFEANEDKGYQYNEYGGQKSNWDSSKDASFQRASSNFSNDGNEQKKQKMDDLSAVNWDPEEIAGFEKSRLNKFGSSDIKVIVDRDNGNSIKYICQLCTQHTYNQSTIEGHIKLEQHLKKKSMNDNIRKHLEAGDKLPGENSIPLDFSRDGTQSLFADISDGEPQPPGVMDYPDTDSRYNDIYTTEMANCGYDESNFTSCIDEAIDEDPEDNSLSLDPRKIKIVNHKNMSNVFVGDIHDSVKASYVKYLFSRCGVVTSVHLLPEQNRGFVNFDCGDSCCRAIQELNGFDIYGTPIWVDFPDKGEENPSKEDITAFNLVPLKIDNLTQHVPKLIVKKLFSKYGEIKGMKQSKIHRCAYIYMADVSSASHAITCLSGISIFGCQMDVKFLMSKHFKESTDIGTKLWIGGIDQGLSNDSLRKLFVDYGLIQMNRLILKKCAFMSFNSDDNAAKAIAELNGLEVMGNNLHLKYPTRGKFGKDDNKDNQGHMGMNQGNQQGGWNNWGGFNGGYGAPEGWNDGGWSYDSFGNWGHNDSNNYWGGQGPPPQQPWMNQGPGPFRGNKRGPHPHGPPQPGPGKGPEISLSDGPIGDILLKLSKCTVNNEDDSYLSMSIVEYLTRTLKQYKSNAGDTDVTTFLGVAEQKMNAIKDIKAHLNKPKMDIPNIQLNKPNPNKRRFEQRENNYSSRQFNKGSYGNWNNEREYPNKQGSDNYGSYDDNQDEDDDDEPSQNVWADY